jgi:hypothetical protein
LKRKPVSEQNVDAELYEIARQLGVNENINETYVLIGYCKQGSAHYDWISQIALKYNIRFGSGYPIDGKMASAKLLVLYEVEGGEIRFKHDAIFSLNQNETRLCSKNELIAMSYPSSPSIEQYLIFSIEKKLELGNYLFDMRNIERLTSLYEDGAAMKPYVVSLAELLQSRIKVDI